MATSSIHLELQSADALMGFPERRYGFKLTKQTMMPDSDLILEHKMNIMADMQRPFHFSED